jgi:predicted  nucleic acid-binding Zn-ribbon protein
MKTKLALVAFCFMLVIGCNNKEEELQKQIGQLQSEQASQQQNINERDQYFDNVVRAVNEVYTDLEKARVKEAQLVERTEGAEGPARFTNAETRQRLLQNLSDIGSSLKENRKKIAELQAKAHTFHGQIASLNTLINNLKQSLQEREASIAQLETRIQGLETTVAEKTKTIVEKEMVIDEQQRTLNTAFYVVGTRDELKKKGIITDEGGFLWGLLGSTTVMTDDVDQTLFTSIDKTSDHTIHVGGKIDEILPRRNQESFAMAQPDNHTSDLTIVSPEKFWQDKYLVIVLD